MRILLHIYKRASRAAKPITYLAAIAGLSVALGWPALAGSPLEGWTRIELEGRKFLIAHGRTVIERWQEPSLVVVTSDLRALGRRRRHRAFAETDQGGRPVRWIEISDGRRARLHVFAAATGRLEVATFRPVGEGASGWRPAGVEGLEVGSDAAGALDPWTLLARLDDLAARGAGDTIDVLTRHGLRRFAVRREPAGRRRTTLEALDPPAGRQRVVLEAVRVEILPADGGETLLGLIGPTALTIDRGSGALLSIEGVRPGVPGKIRLTLRRWSSAERPPLRPPWGDFPRRPATDGDAG